MPWLDEAIGWLSEKFVFDEVAKELDRSAAALRGGDLDARHSAVRKLTYIKHLDTVSLLVGALKDAEPSVRGAAAVALGYKVSADAVTPLAVLLADADSTVRAKAVEALDEIGLPHTPSWIRFWRDRIVSPVQDARIPDLLGRALGDADLRVRSTALAVLPRHGARGVQIVREQLEARSGPDREAQLEAAWPELTAALKARDAGHRNAAVGALFKLYGDRAVRPLAEALRDSSPEVRRAAVDAVTLLGPREALADLLGRLGDPDEGVVVKVIEGLVCQRNLKTFEPGEEDRIQEELLRLARYREGKVKAVSAWALGEVGRVGAVTTLCELLASSDEPVQVAALEALGKINDPRGVSPILALLERGTGEKPTIAAVRALAKADDVRAIPMLVRLVFAETRSEVDQALGDAFSALAGKAEEAARAELNHPDAGVRLAAVKRAISEPRLVFGLLSQVIEGADEQVRAAGLEVLQKQGFDLAMLARATLTLADKTASTRILAINLIAALKTPDAETLLDDLLKDGNEPEEVYLHSVSALRRLGTESAKAALGKHQGHAKKPVREAVAKALG